MTFKFPSFKWTLSPWDKTRATQKFINNNSSNNNNDYENFLKAKNIHSLIDRYICMCIYIHIYTYMCLYVYTQIYT